ncbi:MAG: CHAT domain-containing protein, partial [Planctomycetota bacterium]|nr:CHAT domain-containing protein [Planctomycetota bacterium]
NLGYCHRSLGDYKDANDAYETALSISRESLGENHYKVGQLLNNQGVNLHAMGDYGAAARALEQSTAIRDRARTPAAATGSARALIDTRFAPQSLLASILARTGNSTRAFEVFEQSIGRGILDDLAVRLRAMPIDLANRRRELTVRTTELERQIESARRKTGPESREILDRLVKEQLATRSELEGLESELNRTLGPVAGSPLALARIQERIPKETALVAWLDHHPVGPKAVDPNGEHWVFVLRSAGPPIVVPVPGSGRDGVWTVDDYETPRRLHSSLRTPNELFPNESLRRLSTRCVGPLIPHLAATKDLPAVANLIVLPSSYFRGFPVELVTPPGIRVSYAASGSLYAHLRSLPAPKTRGLLAIGDPVIPLASEQEPVADGGPVAESGGDTGSSPRIAPLPLTAVEIERITRVGPTKDDTNLVLLGAEANKFRLQELTKADALKKFRYIHLATHGEIDMDRPARSALVLSPFPISNFAKQALQPGVLISDRLTVAEVAEQWDLDADLVVLSACETALGRPTHGDGYLGFAQALLLAGSRSVV